MRGLAYNPGILPAEMIIRQRHRERNCLRERVSVLLMTTNI